MKGIILGDKWDDKGKVVEKRAFIKATKNHKSIELMERYEFEGLAEGVYILQVWFDWEDKRKGKEPDKVVVKKVGGV